MTLHLKSLQRLRPGGSGYPLDAPVLRGFTALCFTRPVTLLCGDNGCGKTTLMELLACKVGAHRIGPPNAPLTEGQRAVRAAAPRFRCAMGPRPAHCFLFTAEGFSRYVDYVAEEKRAARQELEALPGRYGSAYADALASQPHHATLDALESMYRSPLERQSHGQGFLDFFQSRLAPGGLYLMDEPEAALSHVNQLALVYLMLDAVAQGCQFVLATHSPILAACPDASLYEMEDGALTPRAYDELGSVQFLKHFLRNHERILRAE